MSSTAKPKTVGRATSVWPHLRAVLILVHLFALVILSLPSSYRLSNRKHWDKPKQQADMRRWADTLGVETKTLDSFLWDWTQRYVSVRKGIARPFLKYADYAGVRQGWTMFSSPRRRTGRYEIEVEIDGKYELLYRTKDGNAEWHRGAFEHNRLRKLMARVTTHPQEPAFSEFSIWVARELAAEFPGAARGKVSLYTWDMLGPGDVRAGVEPDVGITRSQIHRLDDYR